jgi:tripartite-type tricarboxylate transporter receptor subunit TctC
MRLPFCAFVALMAVLGSSPVEAKTAAAEIYPTRPVRMVVATAMGSGVDSIARMVAPKLSEAWKQPVVVDNRAGEGGTIAAELVAKSTPNGYTLLTHSSAHIVSASLRANLPYSPLNDFAPVAPLTSQAYLLVVSKQAGIDSVKDLIAAAKVKPGAFNFTSAGIGSGTHLMAEKFNVGAGIRLGHVPTVGAAAGNEAVISGRALYWFSSITPATPHIREGRLVVLGVSGAKRLTAMPNVPTVAEAGLPGYDAKLWYGLWAPAGTPKAVVEKLSKDVARALAAPDVRDQLAKLSAEAMSMTPIEFARFVGAEARDVAQTVKLAGIKPQ